eukprot:scaffold20497_cov69-Phaeocystis_antarctica.AAC.4
MPTGARLGLAVGVALRPTTATGASRPSVSATASDDRPVRLVIRGRHRWWCADSRCRKRSSLRRTLSFVNSAKGVFITSSRERTRTADTLHFYMRVRDPRDVPPRYSSAAACGQPASTLRRSHFPPVRTSASLTQMGRGAPRPRGRRRQRGAGSRTARASRASSCPSACGAR